MIISYNGRSWFRNAFSWYGTAWPWCYGRILLATIYCLALQGCRNYGTESGWQRPLTDAVAAELDPFGHAVMGSLIGFLLVMRMNASNARYWEGRSHWGTIVNSCRNLVRAGATYTREGKELANLAAGYVTSLRLALRGSRDLSEAAPFLPAELMQAAHGFGNQPTAVAAAMTQWVARQARTGTINAEITRHLEMLISELVNAQGGCEKIQKTPLPFAYVSLIKLMILTYLATLPMVICDRFGWYSPILMAVLALGMFGMEETSLEIEDPFGSNPNCLDLDVLTITIARDTAQLASFAETTAVHAEIG
jgi:putative membrane protein